MLSDHHYSAEDVHTDNLWIFNPFIDNYNLTTAEETELIKSSSDLEFNHSSIQ